MLLEIAEVELPGGVVPPAEQAAGGAHTAHVSLADREGGPVFGAADPDRRAARLEIAEAELAGVVLAPAPERPVGRDGAAGLVADPDGTPAEVGVDQRRLLGAVSLGVVTAAELAVLVVTPAPQAIARVDGAGVVGARRHLDPAGGGADLGRRLGRGRPADAELSLHVAAPAPQAAVEAGAAAVPGAGRDLAPDAAIDLERRRRAIRLGHPQLILGILSPAPEPGLDADRAGVSLAAGHRAQRRHVHHRSRGRLARADRAAPHLALHVLSPAGGAAVPREAAGVLPSGAGVDPVAGHPHRLAVRFDVPRPELALRVGAPAVQRPAPPDRAAVRLAGGDRQPALRRRAGGRHALARATDAAGADGAIVDRGAAALVGAHHALDRDCVGPGEQAHVLVAGREEEQDEECASHGRPSRSVRASAAFAPRG